MNNINEVADGKLIEKNNSTESETGLFILGNKLDLANLRQVFSTTPI